MTRLLTLIVENFRGFVSPQKTQFAIPNGKLGSGLTLVVGPNNSGKTSLVEALLMSANKKITKGERHLKDPKVTIESDKATAVFTNIDKGSQMVLMSNTQHHSIRFDVISARRHWSAASANEFTAEQFTNQSMSRAIVRGAGSGQEVAALLKTINKNAAQKDRFTSLVRRINKSFTSWTIDTDDSNQDYVKYLTGDGHEHRVDFVGDGLISIIAICAHLIADQKGIVLIIDEPELSLHPNAQKELAKIISELSAERQIIVCTHSPHFVNFSDFINGGEIIRLNKEADKECVISQLDKRKDYASKLTGLSEDWHKPQLLDYVAKELLFYERVLFTEGQEDVALIKRYLGEKHLPYRFEIFGYGVGGYGNMEFFLTMAKDLNLEKVVALFDKGTPTYASLKAAFEGPKIMFREIDTEDIRDKAGCNNQCKEVKKEGVFDKAGNLKNTKEAHNFNELLKEIFTFLEVD